MWSFASLFVAILFIIPSSSTISKSLNAGPVDNSVFEKGLVSKKVTVKDVLKHNAAYYKDTKKWLNDVNVLGYVTPWNNHGYDVAKIFAPKFNFLSPVWLQLLPPSERDGKFIIGGTHDIDNGWMDDVKSRNSTKIVPRLIFEHFTGTDFIALFKSPAKRRTLAALIRKTCRQFDGIVLELWSQLGGQAREELSILIGDIGNDLHRDGKLLILVVPPPFHTFPRSDEGMFSRTDFDRLRRIVDFFSLMTYDYSSLQRPGPNSPLQWMRACVEALDPNSASRDQILLGLNMYGLRYTSNGGGHVLGRDLVKFYEKVSSPDTKMMRWDSSSEEHFIEITVDNEKMTIFYPTLKSLERRISLSKNLGTGLSLWEIGQGLDYFYDIF